MRKKKKRKGEKENDSVHTKHFWKLHSSPTTENRQGQPTAENEIAHKPRRFNEIGKPNSIPKKNEQAPETPNLKTQATETQNHATEAQNINLGKQETKQREKQVLQKKPKREAGTKREKHRGANPAKTRDLEQDKGD